MNSKFQLVVKKYVICVEKFYVYNTFIKKKLKWHIVINEKNFINKFELKLITTFH